MALMVKGKALDKCRKHGDNSAFCVAAGSPDRSAAGVVYGQGGGPGGRTKTELSKERCKRVFAQYERAL